MLDYSDLDFILSEDDTKHDIFLELENEERDEVSLDEFEQNVRRRLVELEGKIEKLLEFVKEEAGDWKDHELPFDELDVAQSAASE